MRLRLIPSGLRPAVLDLPWHLPLEAWCCDCLVEAARGIHRHVVRFVSVEDVLYGLKEMPEAAARREYELLRRMAQRDVPAVEAVGVISDRDGLDSVLVTRYLEYSLPFRHVLARPVLPDWRVRLVDALAGLL